jgi:hypothetical protein
LTCAKKLGLSRGDTLVLDSEDELSVLMDYCLLSHRRAGKTLAQIYKDRHPPSPGSDEAYLLDAFLSSWYSLFQVQSVTPGIGATLKDLIQARSLLLVDVGLSQSAASGIAFAGRVMPFAEWHMTTGALLPIPSHSGEAVRRAALKYLPRLHDGRLPPGPEAALAAEVTRILHRAGAATHIRYQ